MPYEKISVYVYNDLIDENLIKAIFAIFYLKLRDDKIIHIVRFIRFYCGNRSKKLVKLADVYYKHHSELFSKMKTIISTDTYLNFP